MYIDSMDEFDQGTEAAKKRVNNDITYVVKYMNGGDNFATSGYSITSVDNEGWFLSYTITGTGSEKTQIQQKLKGRAKSVGLLAGTSTAKGGEYAGGDTVYYFVR